MTKGLSGDIKLAMVSSETLGTSRQKRSLTERASGVDLIQNTQKLLSRVREPSSEEREVLRFIFLPTQAKSLSVVVDENPGHFSNYVRDFVNSEPYLRDYIPPEMMVGIRPRELVIPGSFGKSQAEQLMMIKKRSKALQGKSPDARMLMLPTSTYAQLDILFQEITGKKLFWVGDFFVRCLDQTRFGTADIGRLTPDGPLYVGDWDPRYGIPNSLCAIAAVVFCSFEDKEVKNGIIKE